MTPLLMEVASTDKPTMSGVLGRHLALLVETEALGTKLVSGCSIILQTRAEIGVGVTNSDGLSSWAFSCKDSFDIMNDWFQKTEVWALSWMVRHHLDAII